MKIGDYVRTKDYGIRKISKFLKTPYLDYIICDNPFSREQIDITQIIKSSPNIIDLIEVGDYVNGYLVKDIDYAFDDVVMNNKNARYVPYIDNNKDNYIDEIKSIVTKEQFENMEYRIGE